MFEGRVVLVNGERRTVIFHDYDIGSTIQHGYYTENKCCLNGPMSPHHTTNNYDKAFAAVIKMIDNWVIDTEVIQEIITPGDCPIFGNTLCAIGD